MNRHSHRGLIALFGAVALSASSAWAVPETHGAPALTHSLPARHHPRRAPRTHVAPAAPVAPLALTPPEIVAASAADLTNTLRRLRIYLMNAPDGSRALGPLGAGTQLWFLLPSCRPPDPDDPREMCPIDRLEVSPVNGGGVRAGAMMTLMAGEIPRRAQAFVIEEGTPLVRIRLITPTGVLHYEGVFSASDVRNMPAPIGSEHNDTFNFEFSQYPAR